MKILLHGCCGPCSTFPVKVLKEEGHQIKGFFYNPNIHPFKEYQKRLETYEKFAGKSGLEIIVQDDYALDRFLRETAYREQVRCRFCYLMRLEETAKLAREENCDAFSSSLLVSPYQKHELIRTIGEDIASQYGVAFYYRDFRPGYGEGVQMAKEMELYRQPYCGCIYSERDRYRKEKK